MNQKEGGGGGGLRKTTESVNVLLHPSVNLALRLQGGSRMTQQIKQLIGNGKAERKCK